VDKLVEWQESSFVFNLSKASSIDNWAGGVDAPELSAACNSRDAVPERSCPNEGRSSE
jgi:hypothetical protein